jgi:hypothetical protein
MGTRGRTDTPRAVALAKSIPDISAITVSIFACVSEDKKPPSITGRLVNGQRGPDATPAMFSTGCFPFGLAEPCRQPSCLLRLFLDFRYSHAACLRISTPPRITLPCGLIARNVNGVPDPAALLGNSQPASLLDI